MTKSEQAKFKLLVSLLDEKEVELSSLQSTSGLDVYNFSGALTELLSEGHIVSQDYFGKVTTVKLTAKGLNYIILLKASAINDVVQESETAKTIKVVGKVAGKQLGILGGKIYNVSNKAALKAQEYLIIKSIEREQEKLFNEISDYVDEQEESERQADILASILEKLADKKDCEEHDESDESFVAFGFGEFTFEESDDNEKTEEENDYSDESNEPEENAESKVKSEPVSDSDLDSIKVMGNKILKDLKNIDLKKLEAGYKEKLDAAGLKDAKSNIDLSKVKDFEKEMKSTMSSLLTSLASKLSDIQDEPSKESSESKSSLKDESKQAEKSDEDLISEILKASEELNSIKEDEVKTSKETKEPKKEKEPKKDKKSKEKVKETKEPKEEKKKTPKESKPKKEKVEKEPKEDK